MCCARDLGIRLNVLVELRFLDLACEIGIIEFLAVYEDLVC